MKLRIGLLAMLLLIAVPALCQSGEAELKALIQDYAQTYSRHDSQALANLYADDGLLLPPNRPLVKGRAAIADFWKNLRGKLTLTPVLVHAHGDLGYVVGRFAFNDGPPTGKFTLAARRHANGKWLISSDMWNDDEAPHTEK
jgi:ketosteroid isomerase-like protein